jgi:hypothetical protein
MLSWVDIEDLRVAVYASFSRTGRAPEVGHLATLFGVPETAVREALQALAHDRHLALGADASISFTFVVHSVKCGLTTSGGTLPSEPQGEFCAVNLTVSNHGDKAQPFSALEVKGFIGASQYEADAGASAMANPSTDTFLNSINPGNSINAIVLFDVPVGTQLDTVELHDSLFSAGTSVSVK